MQIMVSKNGEGGDFDSILLFSGPVAGILIFDLMTVWGFHDFIYGFFSSGIGWSRIFVLWGK